MPIDVEVFKREATVVVNNLERGMAFGGEGQYDGAIQSLTDVVISAGLLMQKDPEVGRLLRFDKTILVAEGYQLKAYVKKIIAEPERAAEFAQKMGKIARGNISLDNPYFVEITDAMKEWEETSERGDFFTRPRTD